MNLHVCLQHHLVDVEDCDLYFLFNNQDTFWDFLLVSRWNLVLLEHFEALIQLKQGLQQWWILTVSVSFKLFPYDFNILVTELLSLTSTVLYIEVLSYSWHLLVREHNRSMACLTWLGIKRLQSYSLMTITRWPTILLAKPHNRRRQ